MKKFILLLTVMLATSMSLLAQYSWQTATLVNSSPGTQYFSLLENHWYKIIVPEEGRVEIIVLAEGPWTMQNCVFYRYSENLNTVIQRGTFGMDLNFAGFHADDLGPGVYYFYLEGRYPQDTPMNYTLDITYTFTPCPQAADPEPNDDYEHSSLIESGSTVEGRLGYVSTEGVTDTDDWYKIEVPEEGQIELMATAAGSARFYPYYCTVNGYKNNDIYSRGSFTGNTSSASQTDTITFKATDIGAGTYFIRISRYPSNASGGYYLSYKFTPCALANDPEPNNDYEHSSLLESGKTVEGRLGYRTSDDVTDTDDWYRIVVPEEGQIEFIATATGTVRFYPYYSTVNGYKNNGIYSRGSFTGNTSSASQTDTITFKATDVGAGTYYIKIHQYPGTGGGGYRLYYKFTPCPQAADPEPNNEYQRYCRLLNGQATEGRMGYRTSDDVTDTDDWYRIIVPKDGPVDITVTATETLKLYPYESKICSIRDNNLYNLSGFTGNNGSSNSDIITYQNNNMAAGIYYIKIHRYSGSGGYSIIYNGPISDISGDVDGDGELTIGDVADLIDFLLKGDSSSTLANADVDGDGEVTIGDVTDLIDILLGFNN